MLIFLLFGSHFKKNAKFRIAPKNCNGKRLKRQKPFIFVQLFVAFVFFLEISTRYLSFVISKMHTNPMVLANIHTKYEDECIGNMTHVWELYSNFGSYWWYSIRGRFFPLTIMLCYSVNFSQSYFVIWFRAAWKRVIDA